MVAVKRVYADQIGVEVVAEEINVMSRMRHRNLVEFLGYSRTERNVLLVLEYMEQSLCSLVYQVRGVLLLHRWGCWAR